jgi:PAS domain S-box-containing protein
VIYVVDEVIPSLLDALGSIAVIQSDEKGIITGWNAGARMLFGYRASQIVGKNRRVLYRDQDVWAGKGTGTLAAASAEPREMNDWRVRADGTHVWVRCSIARFDHGAKKGYVETIAALADVDTTPLKTELEKRKGTEESLREALAELRRTSEETMNELRIMTSALRNEIGRRKAAEDELRRLTEQVAAAPVVVPVVEKEEIAIEAPAGLEWQPLSETAPDVVLRECALLQRTGTLFVSFDHREKELFFEEGRLFSCASNDAGKFLAERLVRSGTISEEQRQKALEIKQASSLALGRILLILGAIDEAQLVAAMRAKLEDEIAELLTWRDGRYAFVEGEVPSLQLVPLRIDVDALLAPPVVYIASRKSGKVHQVTCISARRISGGARVEVLTTDGFERCRQCFR